MRSIRRLLLAGIFLLQAASSWAKDGQWISKNMSSGPYFLSYVVYLPADYTPKKTWPTIIFLHGSGENGTDGWVQTRVGLGPVISRHPERFPAIVIFPQSPPGVDWTERIAGDASPLISDFVFAALDQTLQEYNGDSRHVFLTGLSSGGFGAWSWGAQAPHRFAGLMPLCGAGDPTTMAAPLREMPTWVFHGARDPVVPVAGSREMVAALRAAGNAGVRYTEYPNSGHNIWDMTYQNPAVTSWFFSH
jgi:predicted peptidase